MNDEEIALLERRYATAKNAAIALFVLCLLCMLVFVGGFLNGPDELNKPVPEQAPFRPSVSGERNNPKPVPDASELTWKPEAAR